MCIICYTDKVQISDEILKKMWDANPDGAGFAWVESNKAHYRKGFMKFEDLINALPEDRSHLMLHFRIATSGKIDGAHCHPFDFKNPLQESGITNRLLFHNGIISVNWKEKEEDKKEHSDTYLFIKSILGKVTHPKVIDYILGNENFSRFAIYDASMSKGSWLLYGTFVDYEGMSVSNKSFDTPPIPKFYQYYGMKYNQYDYDQYNSWDYEYEKKETVGEEILDLEEVEKDGNKCVFCKEILIDKIDIANNLCMDCTIENGVICECGERLSYNDALVGGYCIKCEMEMGI